MFTVSSRVFTIFASVTEMLNCYRRSLKQKQPKTAYKIYDDDIFKELIVFEPLCG